MISCIKGKFYTYIKCLNINVFYNPTSPKTSSNLRGTKAMWLILYLTEVFTKMHISLCSWHIFLP